MDQINVYDFSVLPAISYKQTFLSSDLAIPLTYDSQQNTYVEISF